MTSTFQSFQKTPLGVFVQSALNVRNGGTFAIGGTFLSADGNLCFNNCVFRAGELFPIFEDEDPAVDGTVFAIQEYKGDLYLGGGFPGGIRRLNKETEKFDIIGGGLNGLGENVRGFTVFDGLLILVGDFEDAGGVEDTHRVAAWNGTNFQTMFAVGGFAPDGTFLVRPCRDTTVLNGELYVCGGYEFFNGSPTTQGSPGVRFTGSGWEIAIDDPGGAQFYRAIGPHAGEVWGGGAFVLKSSSGQDFSVTGTIEAIFNIAGVMYIGGPITVVDGVTVQSVARFTAETGWESVGDGFDSVQIVQIIFKFGSDIYIGGEFDKTIDGDILKNILKLDKENNKWVRATVGLGTTGRIQDMTKFKD